MQTDITNTTKEKNSSLGIKLLWFVAIWAASVTALGIVGYIIKLWLKA